MKDEQQFAVWMDIQTANITGKPTAAKGEVLVMSSIKDFWNNKTTHSQQRALRANFFKEIVVHLHNAVYKKVTGTKQGKQQLIQYRSAAPQFKNTRSGGAAFGKMNDQRVLDFMTARLN